jgi:hypothetical protein
LLRFSTEVLSLRVIERDRFKLLISNAAGQVVLGRLALVLDGHPATTSLRLNALLIDDNVDLVFQVILPVAAALGRDAGRIVFKVAPDVLVVRIGRRVVLRDIPGDTLSIMKQVPLRLCEASDLMFMQVCVWFLRLYGGGGAISKLAISPWIAFLLRYCHLNHEVKGVLGIYAHHGLLLMIQICFGIEAKVHVRLPLGRVWPHVLLLDPIF